MKQLPFRSRCMAGRWAVAWLTAIDGVPAKMLRSKSAVCEVRGRDVARLGSGWGVRVAGGFGYAWVGPWRARFAVHG